MSVERIENIDDPRLAAYTSLTDLELRNRLEPEKGIFMAESSKVIGRALDAGYEPVSMLVPSHRIEREKETIERIESFGAPVFSAPDEDIEKLAGFELTRGVLAAMRRKPLLKPCELIKNARKVAILEGITNHTNVGAAFRNAAAFGIDAVFVTPDCSDPLYRRAVRVSMGNVFNVAWTRIPKIDENGGRSWPDAFLAEMREAGFVNAALALRENALPLDDKALKAKGKVALVFGTEGDGLKNSTIEACDYSAMIPMQNGVDSLNVAATTAVAFWEFRNL